MKLLAAIWSELIGMFVDDGNLALHAVILIAAITAAVKLLGLPPLAGGCLLLAGAIGILIASLRRAAHGRR